MNSRFTKFILLIMVYIPFIQGQNLYNPYSHFNLIFESSNKINPYFFSNNPAFLQYDGRDELLSVKGTIKNEEGDFKKFFDPGVNRNYDLSFSGKKVLDSTQIFKGTFAIQKQEMKDWHFLATKDYTTGSPFLLGDSTTGGSRYNGIFMNAQYSAKLFSKILAGISIDYYVDEGLKQISPRPVSEHRDIDVTAGAAYIINSNFSAGFSLRGFDKSEKIIYKEDQSSVDVETILFKIRGFDLPERNAKKGETRYSYNNGYFGSVDGYYHTDQIDAVIFAGNNVQQITVKDDENHPNSEGYWKNLSVNAGAEFLYKLGNGWSTGCLYKFSSDDMWARHPMFNVVVSSSKGYKHSFGAGVQYNKIENFTAGIEVNASVSHIKYDDFYSDVYYNGDRLSINPQIGLSYRWSKVFFTHAAYGYISSNGNNFEKETGNTSNFFTGLTGTDLNYAASDYTGGRYTLKTEINPGKFGMINIYVTYLNINAEDDMSIFYNSRNNLQAVIEFKIKAY